MTIGQPSLFAIESSITEAYDRRSLLALGYFALHIGGLVYGQIASDSTLLACSFDEVERRIAERGTHVAPFQSENSTEIANAFRSAMYSDEPLPRYFTLEYREFADTIRSRRIVWAPDGDEAFDDSSYVLQFDVGDLVRLIAFRCPSGMYHDSPSLRDVYLPADDYYGILRNWHAAFKAEWAAMPKLHVEGT